MSNHRVRVLLLLQRPEAWTNLASVWTSMHAKAVFEPSVLLLPYNAEDPQTSASMDVVLRKLLKSEGVPFKVWDSSWNLKTGLFDAVIINHPYDRERPRALWFDRLAAAIPLSVYIPYGLSMGGGKKNCRLQFSQPTQTGASVVVARSDWEKRLYARYCPTGGKNVHVLGHPRFDGLLRNLDKQAPLEMTNAVGNRFAILWNSHFSFTISYSQSSNFSTFDLLGPELFEFAKQNSAWLCLIWRPHPGMFPLFIREGLSSQSELSSLRGELANIGIVLDESASHLPAFNASDALLTDIGSFLLEYLPTTKPILALINPEGEPLNEESSALVTHYSRASNIGDVIQFIDELQSHGLPDQTAALDQHLPNLDGRAGERVSNLIYNLATGTHLNQDIPCSIEDSAHEPEWSCAINQPDHSIESCVRSSSPPTPVLDKLIDELRTLRDLKAREPRWRKRMRCANNSVRTSFGEKIKHIPTLMHAVEIFRVAKARRIESANR